MSKVKFNQLIGALSGRVGQLIFYQADGQILARRVPQITAERSAKQKASSDRFLAAQHYAARALADPVLKAAYKAACQGHQNPGNLAVRDALRPPVVDSINLDAYTGKPGQVVTVRATDDFRVTEVKVTILGPTGELIEEGLARLRGEAGEWRYTSQTEVPAGQTVSVSAVAKDTPGNQAEGQRWHHLPVSV